MDDTGLATVPAEYLHLVTWAKGIKDKMVAEHPGNENDDICPVIMFERDGKTIATATADKVDRVRGMQLFMVGATGFAADWAVATLDAHYADDRFYKRYGRLPDPGELQNLCDDEGACDLGLITDTVFVVRMARDLEQPAVFISIPYHVDRTLEQRTFRDAVKAKAVMRRNPAVIKKDHLFYTVTKRCHWMDDGVVFITETDNSGMGGRVVRDMRAGYAVPPYIEAAHEAGFDVNQMEVDRMMANIIKKLGHSVEGLEPYDGPEGKSSPLIQMLDAVGRVDAHRAKESDDLERERRRQQRLNGQPSDEDRVRWEDAIPVEVRAKM